MPVHEDPEIPEIPKFKSQQQGPAKHETVDISSIPSSSETPEFLLTPQQPEAPKAPAPAPEEPEQDPLPEFDPRHQQTFLGLLHVGYLKKTFTWFGHVFEIKTLSSEEVLEIALAVRDWKDTISEGRAYATATAAACCVSVDGQPLPLPISNEVTDTPFTNRFNYVKNSWHPVTVDAVFNQYILLENQVAEVIEAMGKAVG
jgi:hypothetical protein